MNNLILQETEKGVSLTDGTLSLTGDFSLLTKRISPTNIKSELLYKIIKPKNYETPPVVLDATAGLGEDSFLIAAMGCQVHLYEYNPYIYSLLEDAHKRGLENPGIASIMKRMILHNEDSILAMKNFTPSPDIILLDPMFPKRQKSGLIKKKFQLLQQLEMPCLNEEELLNAALSLNPQKIIIKRPLTGPKLGGKNPSYSLNGESIRYDVLFLHN